MFNPGFFLIFLFSVAWCQSSLDINKHLFTTTVANHYKTSVGLLANHILKPLADAPVPETSLDATPIVTNLRTNVVEFSTQLKLTNTRLDELRVKLDQSVEALVAQHSATQQQLVNVEAEIQRMNVQISSTDSQIADIGNQVNRAEENLRNQEEAVRTAERKVEDARNCITRGKRGIGKVWKKAWKQLKKVVNAPCAVINYGGINGAKDGRNRAQQHRDSLANTLRDLHHRRNQYVATRNSLQGQKASLDQQKVSFQNTINGLSAQRNSAVAFGENVKKVLVHVSTLHGKSLVFKDAVYKLIDMETVLTPMEVIANQVISFTGDAMDANFFNSVKQVITSSINALKVKLPLYPLIEISI